MQIRLSDLHTREVINICDGTRMGYVDDACIKAHTGDVAALIVPGKCKYFGLFGREDDYIIPWECIKRIGDDLIIVEVHGEYHREKRKKKFYF